jgi:hypothetical protein
VIVDYGLLRKTYLRVAIVTPQESALFLVLVIFYF